MRNIEFLQSLVLALEFVTMRQNIRPMQTAFLIVKLPVSRLSVYYDLTPKLDLILGYTYSTYISSYLLLWFDSIVSIARRDY